MKVTLTSWTKDPIEAIYTAWLCSKTRDPLEEILSTVHDSEESREHEKRKIFSLIIDLALPVAEFASFNFVFEDMSITFREQLVRHRTAAYWLQSQRVLDMSKYYEDRMYEVPEALIKCGNDKVIEKYHLHHAEAQALYNNMVDAGVPPQDARSHMGLDCLHRGSMTINMRNLITMVSKRCCWIAQDSLWGPVIYGMINELATKIDDDFRQLAKPPCFSAKGRDACKFGAENMQRREGHDPNPCCPLWYCQDRNKNSSMVNRKEDYWRQIQDNEQDQLLTDRMMVHRSKLWGRDPFTGARISR